MVKKFLKSKSKRVSAKKRYKIERKVRQHNKKVKKEVKAKVKSSVKKRKIVTVPGDCPFKETILKEAISLRESLKQKKQEKRDEIKANRKAKREIVLAEKRGLPAIPKGEKTNSSDAETNTNAQLTNAEDKKVKSIEDLMKRAQERGYQFEKIELSQKNRDPSLKAFYREFQQVIGDSDVIIQVLDSRDPLGTRSAEAEEAVRNQSDKKLIMVLNKCDLVPVENLKKWVLYLKQTVGCAVLPFKSNTQKQKNRFGSIGVVNMTTNQAALDTKKSIGVSDLLGLLGTWARGAAGSLTVGVIGMPNVGKSSLINSLKRSKACNVGAKPGVTRSCQVVLLDSKLRLIDSPGVIHSKDQGNEVMKVETILARVPKTTLMNQYAIPEFEEEEEFLCLIAKKFGQMKKGGVPNPAAAEQKIIHDWNTGAIRFFTEPPELTSTTTATAFVSDLSQPFSLDDYQEPSLKPDDEMEDDNESEEELDIEMEEEDKPIPRVTRSAAKKAVSFAVNTEILGTRKQRKTKGAETTPPATKSKLHGLVATKKTLFKKLRKSKRKNSKEASNLANLIEDINL